MGFAASRRMARNRQLRVLMVVWTAFCTGSAAQGALLVVFVFSVGGAAAVGAVTMVRVLPGGLLAPLAATLAISPRPQLHLAIGIGARGAVMVATIIAVLSGAPLGVVLALVAADSLMSAAVRPLHGALVVRLADTVAEAGAGNAVTSSLINASGLAGPALAGLALGLAGIGWSFALPAAAFAAGTAAALVIVVPRAEDEPDPSVSRRSQRSVRSHMSAVGTGFRAIVASRPAAATATLFVVNMMLHGAWFVATASVAEELLRLR